MEVLTDLTKVPEEGIPANLLGGANAIVVIPSMVKGGFIVGGQHGRGVISVKSSTAGPNGRTWSEPGFVKLTGGNVGWQIGLESVDMVFLVMNKDGVDSLLSDKFTIGGNLSVAAGPVGRNANAATDVKLGAGLLGYSRSKGLFAGATLDGAAVHADNDANDAVYGTITLKDIIVPKVAPHEKRSATIQTWQEFLQRVTAK